MGDAMRAHSKPSSKRSLPPPFSPSIRRRPRLHLQYHLRHRGVYELVVGAAIEGGETKDESACNTRRERRRQHERATDSV